MIETINPQLEDDMTALKDMEYSTAHDELAYQRSLNMALTDQSLNEVAQNADVLSDYYNSENLESVDLLGALSDPNSGALTSKELNSYQLSAETITLEGVKRAIKHAEVLAYMKHQQAEQERRMVLDIIDREAAQQNGGEKKPQSKQNSARITAKEADSVRITAKGSVRITAKETKKTFDLAA